ncbi:MAG: sulfur carrier protein ThiS [Planctomycetaceae bacterium]|nr:sulfur carrier protein ThiS [Planctomycetaceae bacterium]
MNLIINGENFDFSEGKTVRQLLTQLQLAGHPVAVERNGNLVPHSTFDQTELNERDSLEIVTLVGGG